MLCFCRRGYLLTWFIQDLQMQLVDPSDLSLVERLTQELQMLREKVEHQNATYINHKVSISTKTM